MRYSIVYAVLRPEIQERLSVGIIIVDGDKIEMRYSLEKLNVLRPLYPKKEFDFLERVITAMPGSKSLASVDGINYLTRYSNNLITVSPLASVDIDGTEDNKNWLFRSYVFDNDKAIA